MKSELKKVVRALSFSYAIIVKFRLLIEKRTDIRSIEAIFKDITHALKLISKS